MCHWCQLVFSRETSADDPFVVANGRSPSGNCLLRVTRAHVRTLTDLPVAEMAAVLAGLARARRPVGRARRCSS